MPIRDVTFHELTDTDQLARSCERRRLADFVVLDTEFVRERTFYPALGLVQLSDGKHPDLDLVDPLAIDDLTPLRDLLAAREIPKVLHSCSEDLEVFHHHLGTVPTPLVDTQVAAAMAGLDYSMGYARLVKELCGVELPKGHTRSNWLKRPLSDAQKRYAALDVEYLPRCWEVLEEKLEHLGRLHWLEEDCARLTDPARFEVDDEAVYRKIARGRRLQGPQLAALRALSRWREAQARERNLPRNFVLKEQALAAVALRRPKSIEALQRIKELDARDLKRHGKTLVRLVAETRDLPADEMPDRFPPPIDLRPHKKTVDALRKRIREVADDLSVPVELLAGKRQVEALLRRHLEGAEEPLPKALRG